MPPAQQAPAQQDMGDEQQDMGDDRKGKIDDKAYKALREKDLLKDDYKMDSFEHLVLEMGKTGDCDVTFMQLLKCGCCATCQCCGQIQYVVVDPGHIQPGNHSDGTNLLFGPGVHILCNIWRSSRDSQNRVTEGAVVQSGTKVVAVVKQGFVGLAFEKGEPLLLPPGMHQWDNADVVWESMIDLSSSRIPMGPLTLVTVEEGYAAITQDNGVQKILEGGKSYMLTHQNWKLLGWLSCKMQTNKFGPLVMTTGDNINLNIVANVNWFVKDSKVASGKNVDTSAGRDPLAFIREDVILQCTSALASLVGAVQYGSRGTQGLQKATRDGPSEDQREPEDGRCGTDFEPKTGRQALWDPQRLSIAVEDANAITLQYGVEVLTINLISASPADHKLVEIMSRGAVAAVAAEETMKEARAKAQSALVTAEAEAVSAKATADAMIIKSKSEAEAKQIAAEADAMSERLRAQGAKDAGQLMSESEVAVQMAKLKVAYGPFTDKKANSFFFGLQGPGDLPAALLGNSLAAQTGVADLDMKGSGGGGGSASSAAAVPGWGFR